MPLRMGCGWRQRGADTALGAASAGGSRAHGAGCYVGTMSGALGLSAMACAARHIFLVFPRVRGYPRCLSTIPPERNHWGITRLAYDTRQGFYGVIQCTYVQYKTMSDVHDLERLQRPPCHRVWKLHSPRMCHAIRARLSSITSSQTIWKPFSPRLMPILTSPAYPPTYSENFMSTCSAASSPMAFCDWGVTPVTTSCCSPSAASGGGFARRVQGGAWRRRRPTWSSR